MKLLLILPHGPIHRAGSGTYKRALRYAPLTLATLVALIPKELGIEVQIIDEGVDNWSPRDYLDVDLVGVSAMTGTAQRAYSIADYYRDNEVPVIMGGVHPTLLPEEAKEHADCVIVGLAEQTWPQALRDFTQNNLKPFYHMKSSSNNDAFYTPMPDRSIFDKKKYITVNSIEATRGCSFTCSFCAVAKAWGNKYYMRPVQDIITEISMLDGKELCFLDPSLTCRRDFSLKLFREMKKLKKWWVGCATIDVAQDPELLKAMAESGCKGLLIGFESTSQASLVEVNKYFNHADQYVDAVKRFHDYGIAIQACFVFGLDTDGKDVFKRTVDFIYKSEIDLPQFSVLTPFPGTQVFAEMEIENRIIDRNWTLYDAEHVVFQPKNMSVEQLQEGLIYAWKKSYSLRSIFKRLSGSRCLLSIAVPANLGYNFYAKHLASYTPDKMQQDRIIV